MTTSIYTSNYRLNLTKYWQQYYSGWTIPDEFVVHHILPQSEGGSHHPRNLIALHKDDHQSIHKCRGDKYSSKGFLNMRNYKHSEETKRKISISNKGRKMSPDTIHKIKIARSNQIISHSEETKKKIKETNIDFWNSERSIEAKNKISETNKNRIHKKGYTLSEDSKRNMSIAAKNKRPEQLSNFKGYYHTPWGKYPSSTSASKNKPSKYLSSESIKKYCKNSENIIKRVQSDSTFNDEDIGKTYKDCGYWFEYK